VLWVAYYFWSGTVVLVGLLCRWLFVDLASFIERLVISFLLLTSTRRKIKKTLQSEGEESKIRYKKMKMKIINDWTRTKQHRATQPDTVSAPERKAYILYYIHTVRRSNFYLTLIFLTYARFFLSFNNIIYYF
jgi:hypothetical protein